MENSNVDSIGDIFLIDPNIKSGNELDNNSSGSIFTSEELSINVQLTAQRKSKSSIVVADGKTTIKNGTIGKLVDFISGHNEDSLSTIYTEIGTSYGNLLTNGVAPNLETLGISNINIDFNTSYAPVVTINFIDIRGQLLQYGNESPYSIFFEMPYPIFTLHVKGFYGKGIKYELHLTKFNGKFNSENGSFEIQCDFIGYTYAFLSDLLIGYLKAIPYTSYGKSLISEKALDTEFFTFKDLNETAQKTKVEINKLKSDSTGDIPAIAEGEAKIETITTLKTNLTEYLASFIENKGVQNSVGVIVTSDTELEKNIKSLNKLINDLIVEENKSSVSTKEYNINADYGIIALNKTLFKISLPFKSSDYDIDSTLLYAITALSNEPIIKDLKDVKEVWGIDISNLYNSINTTIELLRERVNKAREVSAKSLVINLGQIKTIDGRSLPPTIGSYFKVLCNHVDLLMESIKNVGIKANSSDNATNRKNELQSAINDKSIDVDHVTAFPDYKVKNDKTNALEEQWIGKIAPNLPEVLFINEIIEGLLSARKEDKLIEAELIDETIGSTTLNWFPISVMDTPFYVKNTDNPYKILQNNGVDFDLIILMAFRATLFLSTNTLNFEDINLMAQLEANNAFLNFPSSRMLALALNKETLNKAIDQFLFKKQPNYQLFFKDLNDNLEYGFQDYHISLARVNKKEDLYKLFNNLPAVNDDLFLNNKKPDNSNSDYIKFLTNNIEFSAVSYDGVTIPSTKETFDIDNIKNSRISDSNLGVYTFLNTKNNGTNSNIAASFYFLDSKLEYTIFKEIISDNSPFDIKNGKYRKIQYQTLTNDTYPIINLTDIEAKKNILYRRNMNNNTFHIVSNFSDKYYVGDLKFSNGERNLISLFGSTFYRNQNKYGKAYLFLASIPFDGVSNKCDIFDGKFINMLNTKSGLVQMSYPWVLYIGAILKRAFDVDGKNLIVFNKNYDDKNVQLIRGYFGDTPPSEKQLLFSDNEHYKKGVFNIESDDPDDYPAINPIILNLPMQVKKEFINKFESWVDSEFVVIRNELELFKTSSESKIKKFYNDIETKPNDLFLPDNKAILNDNFFKNYLNFGLNNYTNISVFDFDLELSPEGNGSKLLTKFITSSILMVNNTCKIWQLNDYLVDTKIQVNKMNFKHYQKAFVDELNKLAMNYSADKNAIDTETNQEVFQTLNGEDIRLKIYKDIKSIYDKWICGSDYNYLKRSAGDENNKSLFQSFSFINRTYDDISDDFKINLPKITSNLLESYNQPIYAHISKILGDNNFNFMPLPNYVNFSNVAEAKAIFTPYSWANMVEETIPKFVCMYIGEYSNKLDLGFNNKGDAANILSSITTEGIKIDQKGIIGGDFVNTTGKLIKIPIFLLKFGDQNQSIFKSINITQSEFTNTNESLTIIDEMAKGQGIGQNLFDVYQNRSYSVDIEMMGNAMIQPFMYFQLDNIPMFRGLYLVIKVSHKISNNSMITTVKGVRIKEVKTKMVDDSTLFDAFFSDLTNINTGNGALNKLSSSGDYPSSEYSKFITETLPAKTTGWLVQGYDGKGEGWSLDKTMIYRYGIKEVIDFLILLGNRWHTHAINKDYNDVILFNDLSPLNGKNVKGHQGHKTGLMIDIRPIGKRIKGGPNNMNGIPSPSSEDYSVEGNEEFIKLMLNLAKTNGFGKIKTIKGVYYGDVHLQTMFNNYYKESPSRLLVAPSKEHDNHMHIEFFPPDRVTKDIAENNIDTSVGTNGIIGYLSENKLGSLSKENKIKFLGKIKYGN